MSTETSIISTGPSTGGAQGTSAPPVGVLHRSAAPGRNPGDAVFKYLTLAFAGVVFLFVFLMAYEMYRGSSLSIEKFGWSFLTGTVWDPVQEQYGALPFIVGTLLSSVMALVVALPLSIGVAIFLAELAPRWLERPLSFMIELLAAIPSIVYGLWGVFVLVPFLRTGVEPFLIRKFGSVPFFHGVPFGFGLAAAALILAIMVIPIITSISRDVLRSIPRAQREAAYALGATPWETTRIVLSASKSGIFGATLLGLGRAIGETMAVTMVIGNRPEIPHSIFDPAYSMASVIANEFTEATSDMYISSLIEIALILFAVTVVLNGAARLIVWGVTRRFASS
ncbi:MAG TPA: phosphate ABC transporter permease subunit PstC [Bacteroidota bacterium]|nr:phosphate ABC transporter permease subunit PstC [Bacteroidota bacterium]